MRKFKISKIYLEMFGWKLKNENITILKIYQDITLQDQNNQNTILLDD